MEPPADTKNRMKTLHIIYVFSKLRGWGIALSAHQAKHGKVPIILNN